jgi:molybdate transport system substrate-binding protein
MRTRGVAALAVMAMLLGGCGSAAPAGSSSGLHGSITVLAAASLTGAFTSMGAAFQHEHPGTTVHFVFAGSSTLAAQIQQGAAADLFASADQPNMDRLVSSGLVLGSPSTFARNRLEIVVGSGNPHRIAGLADLNRPGLVVVLCAPAVPCGRYAEQAFQKAGLALRPASQEADVNAVVSKVALGEADAGIVYATDIAAAGSRVEGVDIPANLNVIAAYPIAVLKDSQNVSLARAFVGFVLENAPRAASDGQRILARYGFLAP